MGLAALLREAGIETLIDIRRYPTGRRQPHLAHEWLAEDLPARGIGYEWWDEALGGRRSADPSTMAETSWHSPAFAAYRAHMSTPEFREALAGLEARAAAGESLAVMCRDRVMAVSSAPHRGCRDARWLGGRAPHRPRSERPHRVSLPKLTRQARSPRAARSDGSRIRKRARADVARQCVSSFSRSLTTAR